MSTEFETRHLWTPPKLRIYNHYNRCNIKHILATAKLILTVHIIFKDTWEKQSITLLKHHQVSIELEVILQRRRSVFDRGGWSEMFSDSGQYASGMARVHGPALGLLVGSRGNRSHTVWEHFRSAPPLSKRLRWRCTSMFSVYQWSVLKQWSPTLLQRPRKLRGFSVFKVPREAFSVKIVLEKLKFTLQKCIFDLMHDFYR